MNYVTIYKPNKKDNKYGIEVPILQIIGQKRITQTVFLVNSN